MDKNILKTVLADNQAEVLECRKLLIITRNTERTLEISGKVIEVVPVWK